MVELIAKNETTQEPKNSALGEAVAMLRLDLCDLLHANGAEINSVPFVDVLLTWEPNLTSFVARLESLFFLSPLRWRWRSVSAASISASITSVMW